MTRTWLQAIRHEHLLAAGFVRRKGRHVTPEAPVATAGKGVTDVPTDRAVGDDAPVAARIDEHVPIGATVPRPRVAPTPPAVDARIERHGTVGLGR